MKIFLILLLLIAIILLSLVYALKHRKKKSINKTTVAKLIQKFEQMTILDKGDTYYEVVELVGHVCNQELVETPFTKKKVAYYVASANVLAKKYETFKDNKGFDQNKIINIEKTIYNSRSNNNLLFMDESSSDYVVIETSSGGCQMDIPTITQKEISKELFDSSNLNITTPFDNSEILGYKVEEKALENNSLVHVVGEARKSGGKIHICLSRNLKSPFMISTNNN